jgi:lipopolysaccharide/colanic/teichoic acid biosynthesis glycosyltransferase
MKRFADIIFSFIAILFLLPFFLVIALFIVMDSKGGIFYKQTRVGKNRNTFLLFKFRTMKIDSDKQGLLTVGQDKRITRVGKFLRKCKMDELPQFFNVLIGNMSLVGPRPEVPKYVKMYNDEQLKVLSVKPGITDYASLLYFEESKQLAESQNPEEFYINTIMPHKLELSLHYLQKQSFLFDMGILLKTFLRILGFYKHN